MDTTLSYLNNFFILVHVGDCQAMNVKNDVEHNLVHPTVVLIASEGNPVEVNCQVTCQREVGWYSPVLRLFIPDNGVFPFIDLAESEDSQGKHDHDMQVSKYHAKFSIQLTNFSTAIAVCGVHYRSRGEDNSTYSFEPSFVVIDNTLDHLVTCNNNDHVRLVIVSTVTGIFGLLIVSLLAIVGFLFLKLRRDTASVEVNPLLYVKEEGVDSEEKKDTLKREFEAAKLSSMNGSSSSRQIEVDHKLPDKIKSRENGTLLP